MCLSHNSKTVTICSNAEYKISLVIDLNYHGWVKMGFFSFEITFNFVFDLKQLMILKWLLFT